MIKGQDSTIMLTVATNSIFGISKIIDGAASITEMPTLLKLAVYMPPSPAKAAPRVRRKKYLSKNYSK